MIRPGGIPFLLTLLGLLSGSMNLNALAQSRWADWQAQLEVGGWAATTGAQPFWLRANQSGLIPMSSPAATLRAGFWKAYAQPDSTKRPHRFSWSAGLQVVTNAAANPQVLLPEVYIKGRWKGLELSAGRWRQLTGLGDSTLSSGFINGSGNALPMPRVLLATPGYVPLNFTRKWVAINAGYGHGWFNVPYIQGSYLHQKYLYVRVGKPAHRLKGYVGINHEVQWGGQADYLVGSLIAVDGKLPSQFKYYPDVVLGIRPKDWQNMDYTSFDGAYWFGNGLGSMDLGLELTRSTGSWLFYHQHIYEDFSGLLWHNFPDGLTGISWHRTAQAKPGWLHRVFAEFLSTMNQSGSSFDLTASYQGDDDYFNHGQYREGWSYLGRSLGTPFIMPQNELRPDNRKALFFPNNRLNMGYLGAMGQLGDHLSWTLRTSYSRNYGTYTNPYASPYAQFSASVGVQLSLPRRPKTTLTASMALDQGQLLPNTIGGYLSLQKRW